MPLTGSLVAAYRARRGVTPLDDAEDWQAEVEMFAAYLLMVGLGTFAGLAVIQIPQGPLFAMMFALFCGLLGFAVGTGIPLQLVAWKRLHRPALQGAWWRWGVPLTMATGAFVAGLAAELA